jgi:hypothetical protein
MATHANQLTLRGLDPRVLAEIERLAEARGISLNKAALILLERGAGVQKVGAQARKIGSNLDRFVGIWPPAEASNFLRSIQSLDQVADELWK